MLVQGWWFKGCWYFKIETPPNNKGGELVDIVEVCTGELKNYYKRGSIEHKIYQETGIDVGDVPGKVTIVMERGFLQDVTFEYN